MTAFELSRQLVNAAGLIENCHTPIEFVALKKSYLDGLRESIFRLLDDQKRPDREQIIELLSWNQPVYLLADHFRKAAALLTAPRIRTGGTHWEISYEGERAIIDANLIGLKMIEVLLKHPNRPYSAKDLREEANADDKARARTDEAGIENIDKETQAALRNLTPEAIESYLDKRGIKDPAERTQQREMIEKYKSANVDRHGRSRTTSDAHRKAVTRAINAVFSQIDPKSRLYNHFKQSIQYGESSYYRPDREILWEIS